MLNVLDKKNILASPGKNGGEGAVFAGEDFIYSVKTQAKNRWPILSVSGLSPCLTDWKP